MTPRATLPESSSNLDASHGDRRRSAPDSGRMGKYVFDNRVIGALFVALCVVNALAIQYGFY